MNHINLPEIEDYAWFPKSLRDAMTGFLQVTIDVTGPYAPATPALADLLSTTNTERVVDLASGGGGPWPHMIGQLRTAQPRLQVTLTDLYPNLLAAESLQGADGLTYHRESAALNNPPDRRATRTMFSSMHHFSPADLKATFEAAQRDRLPFFGAEATHRSPTGILLTVLIPLGWFRIDTADLRRRPIARAHRPDRVAGLHLARGRDQTPACAHSADRGGGPANWTAPV